MFPRFLLRVSEYALRQPAEEVVSSELFLSHLFHETRFVSILVELILGYIKLDNVVSL